MANIGSLVADIGVNTSGLSSGLREARRAFSGFTGATTAGLGRMTKGFGVATVAALGLASAIGAAFAARRAVKEFTQFEDALLNLQKLLKDGEGNVRDYIGTVDDLGDTFGRNSAEILDGAANFKRAGFTIQESFELQELALKASKTSVLDSVAASNLLISSLKGFKLPASEAARLLDALNEVSNNFATNLDQLIVGFAGFAPIAKLAGLEVSEAIGFLTPIIEVFRSGTESLTALKLAFVRLTSSTKSVVDALAELGVRTKGVAITQRDQFGVMKSGLQIMLEVQEAFKSLEKTERLRLASELTGIRQSGRLNEVLTQQAKVMEITKVAANSLGSINRELEIRMKASSLQIDKAKVAFNRLFREIGDAIDPVVRALAQAFTFLFDRLAKSTALQQTKAQIKFVAEEIRDLMGVMQDLIDLIKSPLDFVEFIQEAAAKKTKDALSEFRDEMRGAGIELKRTLNPAIEKSIEKINDLSEALTSSKLFKQAIGESSIFNRILGAISKTFKDIKFPPLVEEIIKATDKLTDFAITLGTIGRRSKIGILTEDFKFEAPTFLKLPTEPFKGFNDIIRKSLTATEAESEAIEELRERMVSLQDTFLATTKKLRSLNLRDLITLEERDFGIDEATKELNKGLLAANALGIANAKALRLTMNRIIEGNLTAQEVLDERLAIARKGRDTIDPLTKKPFLSAAQFQREADAIKEIGKVARDELLRISDTLVASAGDRVDQLNFQLLEIRKNFDRLNEQRIEIGLKPLPDDVIKKLLQKPIDVFNATKTPIQLEAEILIENAKTPLKKLEENIKRVRKLATDIDKQTGKPFISTEVATRNIELLRQEYEDTFATMTLRAEVFQQFMEGFGRELGGLFNDAILSVWEEDMDAFLDALSDFARRINEILLDALGEAATKKFITPLFERLFNIGGGTTTNQGTSNQGTSNQGTSGNSGQNNNSTGPDLISRTLGGEGDIISKVLGGSNGENNRLKECCCDEITKKQDENTKGIVETLTNGVKNIARGVVNGIKFVGNILAEGVGLIGDTIKKGLDLLGRLFKGMGSLFGNNNVSGGSSGGGGFLGGLLGRGLGFVGGLFGGGGGGGSSTSSSSIAQSAGQIPEIFSKTGNFILHDGGMIMHDGGFVDFNNRANNFQSVNDVFGDSLRPDERFKILQTGEGVLSRDDMANIGGEAGFNALRAGDIFNQDDSSMNINVPVNVEGNRNNPLVADLQDSIEKTVVKVLKKHI